MGVRGTCDEGGGVGVETSLLLPLPPFLLGVRAGGFTGILELSFFSGILKLSLFLIIKGDLVFFTSITRGDSVFSLHVMGT